ncbi:ring-opening amidohydrolase [Rhizohabitans arisaemae]|uniref:ring-opening amidohydrolase n=1 Tax=Rhizohabitans arisaemae TaxID=2720610 RepID=UPI0024B12834|nr:ring-opening amidohydrolase [Rhizohabitans arisaemae]
MQTKPLLLTLATIEDAKRRGHPVIAEDAGPSMDTPNSTTALGIAVAMGEIKMPSAVVGDVRGIGGRYRIGHGVMRDALDADGIWAAIRSSGIDRSPSSPTSADVGAARTDGMLGDRTGQGTR